ncbi:MAG: hypothetical protein LBL48_05685 [Azoarcus sp.]|jgi:hypothetical protein|nr:hypothetical protein [Azoarcus sp.]
MSRRLETLSFKIHLLMNHFINTVKNEYYPGNPMQAMIRLFKTASIIPHVRISRFPRIIPGGLRSCQ